MPTKQRLSKIKSVAQKRQSGLIVVLEDIHDPHNAAAVFRTCEAFGIQEIHLVFHDQNKFNPAIIGKSTSASANKWLSFYTHDNIETCINVLKKEKYQILATVCNEESKSIYDSNFLPTKIALLLGNEHRGLTETAVSLADFHITIPMLGMVQSLNLSVTAGIFIYEIVRQRLASGKSYAILPKIQKNIVGDFLKRT